MKDEGLKEEEHLIGEIFINEYNKFNCTDYHLKPNSVVVENTADDLIFHSNTGATLAVQITKAVVSKEEEIQISEQLKKPLEQIECIIGDVPGPEIIFPAIQRKYDKHYALPENLILVVYAWKIELPRDFKTPQNIEIPFKEVWFVDPQEEHRHAMRIYP